MNWVPNFAKRRFGLRLKMVAGALLLAPTGLLAQASEPDAFTKAAMEKRRDAEATLASAMARVGNDRTDVAALIDAARASLALENPQAALGFLKRASQMKADDGQISAFTGSAMLQLERPADAMEYFNLAAKQGAADRLYLSDRGLANDLLGRQNAAQRDYETALSLTNDPETVRRYAMSLGITGQVDRAVAVLTPQLRGQDRAAWRTRAMILAVAGRQAEAQEIVKATMPGALASNIAPFLARLPSLTPAQQAAAVHFGALPGGVLPGTPPAPLPAKPKPVVVAAAPTAPPAATPASAAPPTARPASAAARPNPLPPPVVVSRTPPVAAPKPAPVAGVVAETIPAPKRPAAPNDLATIMASLTIPEDELQPTAGALDTAALERIKEEQRQAAAAAAEDRKRELVAARAKAEAEAKAKAEADQKKAHPARIWVQVATGANGSALAGDFGRLARKYPAEFTGQKGGTAEWGRTRRLVVGPFPTARAANSWLAAFKKAGGDGFSWSSDAGEEVTPVR